MLNQLSIEEKTKKNSKLENLSKLLFKELDLINKPKSCEKSKYLVCKTNLSCGFACQIHFLILCLKASLYLKRVLILNSKMWIYFDNLNNEKYCKKIINPKNLKFDSYWRCFFDKISSCDLTEDEIERAIEFHNQKDIEY